MKIEGQVTIPADHPCFADHFPGAPLYPGAALLADLVAWVEASAGCVVSEVTRIKFVAPVLPGSVCGFAATVEGDRVVATGAVAGTPCIRGELRIAAATSARGARR